MPTTSGVAVTLNNGVSVVLHGINLLAAAATVSNIQMVSSTVDDIRFSVDTDTSGGTIKWEISPNIVPGSFITRDETVTGAGTYEVDVSATSLTIVPDTQYYIHVFHEIDGNPSNTETFGFIGPSAKAVLTNFTVVSDLFSNVEVAITTDKVGTLYWFATSTRLNNPNHGTIVGNGTTATVSAPGVQSYNYTYSSNELGTTYYIYVTQYTSSPNEYTAVEEILVTLVDLPTITYTGSEVLVHDANELLLPIVSPVLDSTSIFSLGSGSVSTGDVLLYTAVSGLTINPDGTYVFDAPPLSNQTMTVRVWDQGTGLSGTRGTITFDVAGVLNVYEADVTLRPLALRVNTHSTYVFRDETFQVVLDPTIVPPTLGNTFMFVGDVRYDISSINETVIEFEVPLEAPLLDGDFDVTIVSGEQWGVFPQGTRPPRNTKTVTVSGASADEGSVFYQHTGDLAADGDILHWLQTSGAPADGFSVAPTGEWSFESMPSEDAVFSVYVRDGVTGVLGEVGTLTYEYLEYITQSFGSEWAVDMYSSNAFASEWDVYNERVRDFESEWDIYNRVSEPQSSEWDITNYVSNTFSSTWLFSGSVQVGFPSEWVVSQKLPEYVLKPFTSRWDVTFESPIRTVSFESTWDITTQVSQTFRSSWEVDTSVVGTLIGSPLRTMRIISDERVMRVLG